MTTNGTQAAMIGAGPRTGWIELSDLGADAQFPSGAGRQRALLRDEDPDEPPVLVSAPSGRQRVAIVGFSGASRDLAPWDDPEVEIWGLNQLYRHIPRATRWFEIHKWPDFTQDQVEGTDYLAWLQRCPIPLYTAASYPQVGNGLPYPWEPVMGFFGRRYLTSTPAAMLALAISAGFKEIGLYGIDLVTNEEYASQKPCMEYYCGWFEGFTTGLLGYPVQLTIPPTSALLRSTYVYGPESEPSAGLLGPQDFKLRLDELKAEGDRALQRLCNVDGGLAEVDLWLAEWAKQAEPKSSLTAEQLTRIFTARRGGLDTSRLRALDMLRAVDGMRIEAEHWSDALTRKMRGAHLVYQQRKV